jgi:hypothetical protein
MKTLGAIDKVFRRKTRSDLGKKRNKYAGKPVEHKIKRKYEKRIGRKTGIILRMFWRIPMSKEGYRNWKLPLRPKLRKEITKMQKPLYVETNQIDTPEKIEDFVARNYWGGKWVVMGISHAKTKTHRKWVKICTIFVKETPEGNVGKITENKRLSKYNWFFRG